MNKIIISLIILIMLASPLSAEIYNSPFGFSIDIPSHWLIMSKQEVQDNPDLLNFEGEEFKNTNKDLLKKLKQMVNTGQVEFYVNTETSTFFFNDNINVIKTIERFPQTVSELNKLCAQLSDMLAEQLGKLVTVYECSFKKIAGINALYFFTDGVVEGTKSLQIHIPKSPNVKIVITATCKNETYEIISKDFDEIMASFTFNDTKITKNSEVGTEIVTKSEEALKPPELQKERKVQEINYEDGSRYVGDIVNGKRHGKGAYYWPDGRKYLGEFEDNRATGGWFFKTIDHKVWVYQDSEGKWIIKD